MRPRQGGTGAQRVARLARLARPRQADSYRSSIPLIVTTDESASSAGQTW
jgi:hypothetical protein